MRYCSRLRLTTVVDIIVESEVHNTLEAAVTAAGLVETLQGEGPFTVFAPTDTAFAVLPEGVLDGLLADPTGALTDVLLYHVLSGTVLSTDLMDGMTATTLNGDDITVTISNDSVFINDALVTVADIVTDNGVVHVIDAVLIPPVTTVVDVIVESEVHNTLEAAVTAAGLVETLQGEGPFTVFAPTDSAFAALPEGLIDALLADPTGDLTTILLYHVLGGEVLSTDLSDGLTATTLQGDDITVTINDDGIFINNAQVTVADIQTDNGVVHVIDAVLIPVNGGEIELADGGTETTICVGDGAADPLDVTLTGALGLSTAWVITDDQGNILALPDGPPFDLEEAGAGVCLIWHLSWVGELTGAEVGANANDLGGFFDLSNPITVTRNAVNGGEIQLTEDGATEVTICVGDGEPDPLDVTLTGAEGTNSAWVITDTLGNILALPDGPPFDLEDAGAGICLIWHLSFEDGLTGAEVGANAADLVGCFDLSNPITVIRNSVSGGDLTTATGLLVKRLCLNDGDAEYVEVVSNGAEGENIVYVVTDTEANILGLSDIPVIYFDTIDVDTALIWCLGSDNDINDIEIGSNAGELGGCNGLSNAVTVIRDPSGGCEVTCLPPATSSVEVISTTSVKIEWPAVPEVYIYTVRYRPIGTQDWKYAQAYRSRRTLQYLQPGTMYEYQIQTLCLPEESDQSPVGEFSTPMFAVDVPVQLQTRIDLINSDAMSIRVQPNPVVSTLTVNYSLGSETAGKLIISHISGQKILETRLVAPSDVLELDMSNVPSGYYFISLNNGEEIITKKLVKASN